MSITKISPSVVDFDAGITISTADNTDTLTLTSTDADANSGPNLNLYRNSGSPADNDVLGYLKFTGVNDNSEIINYARIRTDLTDASDGTEDGSFYIFAMNAGTERTRVSVVPSETVFNDESQDVDFRVESDVNAHSLFVDGETGKVALGTSTIGNGQLIINTADENHIRMENGSELGQIYVEDGGDVVIFAHGASQNIKFLNSTGSGTERVRIGDNGILFNGDTAAANALDDYEEGTYTPTMFGVTTAGSVAYSSQAGWYTKVGRIVVAYFDINVSSASGMAGTTALTLPVQSDNINAYMGVTYWDVDDDYFDGGKGASGYVYPNTTRIELYQTSDGAKGHNTGNTFKTNQTGRISGSVTYFSAT